MSPLLRPVFRDHVFRGHGRGPRALSCAVKRSSRKTPKPSCRGANKDDGGLAARGRVHRRRPAQWLERGFRLLTFRELHTGKEPPAFAWIEQHFLRAPQRLSRHGLYFASAFLPEIMAWLSEYLGRPSLREANGKPYRNALWPVLSWHSEHRLWPGGGRTIEWFVDVIFQDEASWTAFQQRWHDRPDGQDRSVRGGMTALKCTRRNKAIIER